MEIKLDNKYWIVTDSMNYKLATKSKGKDGKVIWNYQGYYSTIESLLISYKELEIRNSNINNFKDLVKLNQELDNFIREMLKPLRDLPKV